VLFEVWKLYEKPGLADFLFEIDAEDVASAEELAEDYPLEAGEYLDIQEAPNEHDR
jgi:hypothetical protein